LVIQVPVPYVVNPDEIGADGYLKNPDKLIANNVIGKTATIMFPAYDVDDKTPPPVAGAVSEKDLVTFNGKLYTGLIQLSGFNDQWAMQTLQIPINELKFGGVGDFNTNELSIDIDVGNKNFSQNYCSVADLGNGPVYHCGVGEIWCMAVDWVGVNIDVAAPYVLAHGIAADASTWNDVSAPGVISTLNDLGVAWNRFTVDPAGSVAANAGSLGGQISAWLKTMQADRVHIRNSQFHRRVS
jgi:hypothetical protein